MRPVFDVPFALRRLVHRVVHLLDDLLDFEHSRNFDFLSVAGVSLFDLLDVAF